MGEFFNTYNLHSMTNQKILLYLSFLFLLGCQESKSIEQYGKHYQQYKDSYSLQRVVDLMEQGQDAAYVKKILGAPIDMGFDYRYLIDSTGENGCQVGAVFHLNEEKVVDQLWLGEICE